MKDALADYDYMWKLLEGNYPFLKMAERKYSLSMEALKVNYREKIKALGEKYIDFYEYYKIMQMCIGEFHNLAHLCIYTPNFYQARIALEDAERKSNSFDDREEWRFRLYNDPIVKKRYNYLISKEIINQTTPKAIADYEIPPNLTFRDINVDIAYVKINSFNIVHLLEDQKKLRDWFDENANKKYIIIDITGNGGGFSKYWMDSIVAPNLDEDINWTTYYVTPYGEESREQFAFDNVEIDDLNPDLEDLLKLPQINKEDLLEVKYYGMLSISIKPIYEKKIFDGQFFLLVDDSVYSAADNFAMFCKDTGFATVIGENTKGDGGGINVYDAKLPKSGLIIRYRAMHGLNADGSSNVEFGTTPDVSISKYFGHKYVSLLKGCLDYIKSIDK